MHIAADNSDRSTVGISGPIFEDYTFEFIPIIESCDGTKKSGCTSKETRTYSTIKSRNPKFGSLLSDFVPSDTKDHLVHYDPDMKNFTYSDPEIVPRAKMLSKLAAGDYLFFIASLAPFNKDAYSSSDRRTINAWQKKKMAKYIIGYFCVKGVYHVINNWNKINVKGIDPSKNVLKQINQSAHSKRNNDRFVIAVGKKDRKSALLKSALRLTFNGSPFRPTNFAKKIYGNVGFPRGFKLIQEPEKVSALLRAIT